MPRPSHAEEGASLTALLWGIHARHVLDECRREGSGEPDRTHFGVGKARPITAVAIASRSSMPNFAACHRLGGAHQISRPRWFGTFRLAAAARQSTT